MRADDRGCYFLELGVANLRCFGPLATLDLRGDDGNWARWTIVLGDNGTGKTTLLQALAATRPIAQPPATGMPAGTTPAILTSHAVLSRELGDPPGGLIGAQVAVGAETIPISFRRTGAFTQASQYDAEFTMFLVAYGAVRAPGDSGSPDESDDTADATLFDTTATLANPEVWLLNLDHAASKQGPNGPFAARLGQVKRALIDLLPDVGGIEVREPGYGKQASAVPDSGYVEFSTPYGPVRLSGLSLGYQAMVGWMLDLVARMFKRYPNSPDPLAEPAVVLVDEIDLHLHPRWQRRLMDFLTERFPRTQFIATAHSPLVVQAAAGRANIALLRRAPGEGRDHAEIVQDLRVVEGWRVDQLLTSDLFGLDSARSIAAEALLAERRALVEKAKPSPAEKKRLKVLNKRIGELPSQERPQHQQTLDLLADALEMVKKRAAES